MILRLAYLEEQERKLQKGLNIINFTKQITGVDHDPDNTVEKELQQVQEDIKKILSDIKN